MSTKRAKKLSQDYAANTWLIEKLTEGLIHEESLLQPGFPANCLNWVLGHILSRRSSALELLGTDPLWDEEIFALYRSGSEPITAGSPASRYEDLLQDLEDSQQRLDAALARISRQGIEAVVETDRGTKPVWEHLEGLIWHETFHLGQLDILRALALSKREAQS